MKFRQTPPPLPLRKLVTKPPPNTFSKAVTIARKMHEEYGDQHWFKSTRLYTVKNQIAVKVLFDSGFSNDVQHLTEEKFLEDGVLVTFSSF